MSFRRTYKLTRSPKCCTSNALAVPVTPSKSIYYERYPYKVDIIGDRVNYNPTAHYELNRFLFSNKIFQIRNKWSYRNRSIYFINYADVEKVCTNFPDMVIRVHGPVSKKHIKILKEHDFSTELRAYLYYNKFDTKIEFISRNKVSEAQPVIFNFVEQNLKEYRWSTTNFKWYYNFLYCNSSELNEVIGFLKIALSDYMGKYAITNVILLPQVSNIDK